MLIHFVRFNFITMDSLTDTPPFCVLYAIQSNTINAFPFNSYLMLSFDILQKKTHTNTQNNNNSNSNNNNLLYYLFSVFIPKAKKKLYCKRFLSRIRIQCFARDWCDGLIRECLFGQARIETNWKEDRERARGKKETIVNNCVRYASRSSGVHFH